MALIVQKFGGTSVGSIERIEAVADIIIKTQQQGHQVVAVVSAMSGETNRLISLAHEIDSRPSSRELDVLVTTGEQVTASLLAMAIIRRGHPAISLLADQIGIQTDNMFGKARIESICTDRLNQEMEHNRIVIVAGFQGRDREGNITTLGRGGTDTTAVELAGALKAAECQIFTDVDGVYTTDPRIEPNARRLEQITFDEMLEMASLGAKVLHLRSVEAAGHYRLPLRVLSSFCQSKGTLITYEEPDMNKAPVSGVAASKDEVLITLKQLPNQPQIFASLLTVLADAGIAVDMLSQLNHQLDKIDYAFTVHSNDHHQVIELLTHQQESLGFVELACDKEVAKVSVIGIGLKSHVEVIAQFYTAMSHENIRADLVTTSEMKISALLPQKYLELAVRALHSTFLLESIE